MFLPESFEYRWIVFPLIIFGRYFLLCAWAFALFYLWKRKDWLHRKIQQRFPKDSDMRREIGYSFLTALIFGGMAWLTLGSPLRAYTQFYTDPAQHGYGWLFGSFVVLVLLHDTYFYWMHRLMHHPRLYRVMHLVHHKSVNPSPWAAYSFHPLEAIVEAGIVPLAVLIMPVHPISLFAFITWMLWFNVYGHLGYELYPKWMYKHPLGKWLNSTVFHNQHHEKFHGNYGLYFTFWDVWMGTLREDAYEKLETVQNQIQEGKSKQVHPHHSILNTQKQ
ncbi:MAG: sterol desaturase family protein [Saprospiraceae bacterium]